MKTLDQIARIWAIVTVDGCEYRSLHVSGPWGDVRAYYEGRLTLAELQRLWEPRLVAPVKHRFTSEYAQGFEEALDILEAEADERRVQAAAEPDPAPPETVE